MRLSDKGVLAIGVHKYPAKYNVEDPHHVDTDPNQTIHFVAVPDLASH